MAKKKKPAAESIGAADFKARCLELLDRVREHGAEYIVTKHGRPVARVVPTAAPLASLHGVFADRIRITGDIVEGSFEGDWESAQ